VKFLIYLSEPYSVPIGRPLQKVLIKRGYQVRWFCDKEETRDYLDNEMHLLDTVAAVKAYDPDVVLVTTNTVPDFFPGIKVQIFHGFSVGKRSEKKGHFNIRGFFDLYCTQGPSTTKPFKALQQKHPYFDVVETGWPKVDPLFWDDRTSRANPLPVVMISSTFTPRLSLAHDEKALEQIASLSQSGRWKFIVVLHPKMASSVVERIKRMQHENLQFYDTVELIPLMKQADIMLSDTTSAITEFLLQRKPVVTLRNNRPGEYLIDIADASEIGEALQKGLSYPRETMSAIDAFIAQTHPYDDGRSSDRVIDAAVDFVKHKHPKPKPLNLIRRYQIRKKLGYWRFW